MTRNRKLLIWYLALGPGLLVATVGGNELYGYLLVRRELAACRAAGMELDPEKLLPSPVPEDQNAAPLYLAAFEEYERIKTRRAAVYSRDDELLGYLSFDPIPHREKVLAWAKEILDAYDPFFRLIDEAERLPHCRYEDEHYGWPVDLPQLIGGRRLALLLAARAVCGFHVGKTDRAFADLERCIRMRRCLGKTTLLITWLVEVGMVQVGTYHLGNLLQAGHTPAPERAESLLRTIPRREEIWAGFRNATAGDITSLGTPIFGRQRRMWFRLTRLFDREHEGRCLQCCRMAVESAGRPLVEIRSLPWPKDRWYHMSYYEIPGYGGGWQRSDMSRNARMWLQAGAKAVARCDLARIALLLELHRHERGVYPDLLDALRMPDGGELPADPFDGKPYRYRKLTGGYKLWSVGADCIDNGGDGHWDRWDRDTDIVLWLGAQARAAPAEERRKEFEGNKEMIEEILETYEREEATAKGLPSP